jgi:hypothetical protein
MRWKSSSKSFYTSEVHAQVLRLHTCACAQVVDIVLVLCPGPCGGIGVALAISVVVSVGVEVGVTVGVFVLVVLLGMATPTPSSPSTTQIDPWFRDHHRHHLVVHR